MGGSDVNKVAGGGAVAYLGNFPGGTKPTGGRGPGGVRNLSFFIQKKSLEEMKKTMWRK